MNWLKFAWLIRAIYLDDKRLPDLKEIQEMGLLAVKIGQVHALRPDFLPEKKCQHLARLYRNTVSISEEDNRALIEKYANAEFRKNVKEIDYTPIASASVGQVHKAKLKNGKAVAVKIIKGNFKEQFKKDVRSLKRLFKLMIFFYPKLAKVANPVGILENIEEYTLSELDLRNEIKGHALLNKIYENEKSKFDLSRLSFAKVYKKLSGENIMVSDFIKGRTFDELLNSRNLPYQLLLDLFRIHGYHMFAVGTFHGDIHPGNIIFSKGKIYFVDTGAISHCSRRLRNGLLYFFKAMSKDDFGGCAYYMNEMGIRKIKGKRYEEFKKKMIDLYSDFPGKTVSQVSLTKKMMETIKLGVNSGIEFEKGMFPIIKSLMYMDGMVLKCNPSAVLIRDMVKYIEEFEEKMRI